MYGSYEGLMAKHEKLSSHTNFVALRKVPKGVQRPAASVIVRFCFCEFRTLSYSGSCAEQVIVFVRSMLVFVLP